MIMFRNKCQQCAIFSILIWTANGHQSGHTSSSNVNGNETGNENDFVFQDNMSNRPCNNTSKVSKCNNSLDAQTISYIQSGWAPFGSPCDPKLQREVWTDFWLERNLEATIDKFKSPDFQATKTKLCSEFVYQCCSRTRRKCECDLGAVFIDGTCQLVEGALVDHQCEDNLIPNRLSKYKTNTQSQAQPVIVDPRSCLLNFTLKCGGTSKCDCYTHKEATLSICNPRKGKNSLQHAHSLVRSTLQNAKELKWLTFGQKCAIHENFSSKFTTHILVKFEIIMWIEDYTGKASKICDPFQNLECGNDTNICRCFAGFIRQDGECRLKAATPNPGQEIELHHADHADKEHGHHHALDHVHGVSSGSQEVCEWNPEFYFLYAHFHRHHDEAFLNATGNDFIYLSPFHLKSDWFAQPIACVQNATCMEDPGYGVKVCLCKDGMECQSTDDYAATGSHLTRNAKVWILLASRTIFIALHHLN